MGRLWLIAPLVCLLTACGSGAAGGGYRALATPSLSGAATRAIQTPATATPRATRQNPTPNAGATARSTAAYPVGCTPGEVVAFLERFLRDSRGNSCPESSRLAVVGARVPGDGRVRWN